MTPKPLFAALAAVALAGCVSVLPDAQPPSARYLIEPVAYDGAATAVEWTLGVEDPMATRVYDTPKIALLREPGRVEYFARGEWADRAPRLVQAAIVRSFENSGRILGVGDRTMLPVSTYVLQTDIRGLQADYRGGAPTAHFSIYARLTNGRGKVYAARLFEHRAQADADSVPAVAAALDDTVAAAIAELVEWTVAEGNAAYAK